MKTQPQFFVMTVNTITDHFTTVNKNIITVNFMSVNTITVPWTAVNTTVPQSFDDSKYHLSPFDGCEYQHSPFYGLEYHISPLDDCECHLIPFCVCEYHLRLLMTKNTTSVNFTTVNTRDVKTQPFTVIRVFNYNIFSLKPCKPEAPQLL